MLGKYIRGQYDSLFPPKSRKGVKSHKHSKSDRPPYKAGLPRDRHDPR